MTTQPELKVRDIYCVCPAFVCSIIADSVRLHGIGPWQGSATFITVRDLMLAGF